MPPSIEVNATEKCSSWSGGENDRINVTNEKPPVIFVEVNDELNCFLTAINPVEWTEL